MNVQNEPSGGQEKRNHFPEQSAAQALRKPRSVKDAIWIHYTVPENGQEDPDYQEEKRGSQRNSELG